MTAHPHRRLHSLQRLVLWSFAAVGGLVMFVTLTPIVGLWANALSGPWFDPGGDVLVVLGGAADTDGVMGQSSHLRSTYAVMAYRQGGFREVVISGGTPGATPVAESIRGYLVAVGIPSAAIHVEPYARTTRENALFTKPILDRLPGKKVLLTSDYHMARAHGAFTKAGAEVAPWPIPDALKRVGRMEYRWGAFVDVSRETMALGYYFVRGWI